MKIKNHRAEGVAFQKAFYTGDVITPDIVVLHDTAGRLDPGNAVAWLASRNTGKASVHFVIEIDGAITQLVPTNRRANHAGESTYHGRKWCNGFSIGIELVSPGKLTRTNGGSAISWWGQEFGYGAYKLAEVTTPEHGAGVWMPYPPAQIEALIGLLEALFRDVPTLRDITTHWYISPGRKIDPNPLLPLQDIRTRILGHDDPAAPDVEAASVAFADSEAMVRIKVPGDTLNLRRWPSFNPNVIGAVPDGAIVPVLRAGLFGGRQWLLILHGGREGWIVSTYANPIIHTEASS